MFSSGLNVKVITDRALSMNRKRIMSRSCSNEESVCLCLLMALLHTPEERHNTSSNETLRAGTGVNLQALFIGAISLWAETLHLMIRTQLPSEEMLQHPCAVAGGSVVTL